MLRFFRRIEERAQELGNHRRKYIHAIEKHGRLLVDRLEGSGLFDTVHLRKPAGNVATEMDAVLASGRDDEEKLTLLGCYYALQFLHMNIQSIDSLRLESSRNQDTLAVYRKFTALARHDFGELIGAYLARVLDISLGDGPRPEFVVCTVGSRLHQDDVDLGIIDDGSPEREKLNRAIGKMARQMMRYTSVPDFYLSEHVGSKGYTVSFDEYKGRLDRKILDFVSVIEILSVSPIVGSGRLMEKFRKDIHKRYYYRQRRDHRAHEGFLRGVIGELDSLLLWPHDPHLLKPKEDLLRLVGGILWTYRTVYRVRETNPWKAFTILGEKLKKQKPLFDSLERSFTYIETVRHLYQQFAAQEEVIDLENPNERESLQQVALTMGYADVGVIKAWEQLVVHYIEYAKDGRDRVRDLEPAICDHIRRISLFTDWFEVNDDEGTDPETDGPSMIAIDFLHKMRYFRGITYWDDLLEALEDENNGLLRKLLGSLMAMDRTQRLQAIKYYAHWGHQTFYALLRLLTLLGKRSRAYNAGEVFHAMNEAFLETIQGSPDEIRRFSTVFRYYPALTYSYLGMLNGEELSMLHRKFSGEVWDTQVARWQECLCRLCDILLKSSRFFRRAIDRICEWDPHYLHNFGELDKLDRMARGIMAGLVRLPSHQEQSRELGAYYDLEFLRIGLATLQGKPLAQLDTEFTEAADLFLETLFDICKTDVDSRLGKRILTHDLLALFVAGGHARMRAHQDDYDLIVVLNSDSQEIYEYSNQILTRLNREIIRRGIIPQYRFADLFGGYVTRYSELRKYLLDSGGDAYVEMSQLLGARMIVGSGRLRTEFAHSILEECVLKQKGTYLRAVIEEIRSRRTLNTHTDGSPNFNVKERHGGLRALEMGMLLLKVRYNIPDPVGARFWDILSKAHPERKREFYELKGSYQFLNRLRDVYRLSVAPRNELDPEQLNLPAQLLGYRQSGGATAGSRLQADFLRHCKKTAETLERLIEEIIAETAAL